MAIGRVNAPLGDYFEGDTIKAKNISPTNRNMQLPIMNFDSYSKDIPYRDADKGYVVGANSSTIQVYTAEQGKLNLYKKFSNGTGEDDFVSYRDGYLAVGGTNRVSVYNKSGVLQHTTTARSYGTSYVIRGAVVGKGGVLYLLLVDNKSGSLNQVKTKVAKYSRAGEMLWDGGSDSYYNNPYIQYPNTIQYNEYDNYIYIGHNLAGLDTTRIRDGGSSLTYYDSESIKVHKKLPYYIKHDQRNINIYNISNRQKVGEVGIPFAGDIVWSDDEHFLYMSPKISCVFSATGTLIAAMYNQFSNSTSSPQKGVLTQDTTAIYYAESGYGGSGSSARLHFDYKIVGSD